MSNTVTTNAASARTATTGVTDSELKLHNSVAFIKTYTAVTTAVLNNHHIVITQFIRKYALARIHYSYCRLCCSTTPQCPPHSDSRVLPSHVQHILVTGPAPPAASTACAVSVCAGYLLATPMVARDV
jgi:hypothetical protein